MIHTPTRTAHGSKDSKGSYTETLYKIAIDMNDNSDKELQDASTVLFALVGAMKDDPLAVEELSRISNVFSEEMMKTYVERKTTA